MRGWPIILGMVLGFLGFVAVLLWNQIDRPANDFLSDAPSASAIPPSWPASDQPAMPGAFPPSDGAPRPNSQASAGPLPPSFGPLLTLLGLHQPARWSRAPDFILTDLHGKAVQLRQFQGKVVFLNFWATWCAPCLVEMPSMERLHQTFHQTDFVLLAVSLDRHGGPAVNAFAQDMQLTFPILLDPNAEAARSYGVRGLPTTYLIDPDGQLIAAAIGGRDWARTEAKALIAGILRQASALQGDPTQARQ
jgi:peroxiredoxin